MSSRTTEQILNDYANAKTDIANAIADKGVEVPDGSGFNDFAGLINGIGGELPEIESDDEGKLLAVVDGIWDKAKPEDITVGNAEQLISKISVSDCAPYNFRTAGGALEIGDRIKEKAIIGGTIAWNQLTQANVTHTENNIAVTKNNDGSVTLNGTANATGALGTHKVIKTITEHKYLISSSNSTLSIYSNIGVNVSYTGSTIVAETTSKDGASITFGANSGDQFDNVTAWLCVFDLTQMFGSTIADYVYSLELATTGAGVLWFKKLFPKTYYEYNAGELASVQASAHKTVGFNQFDESRLTNLSDITKTANGWSGISATWNVRTNTDGWERIQYIKGLSYCASVVMTPSSGMSNVRIQWEYTDGTVTIGSYVAAGSKGISVAVSDASKTISKCHLTYGSGGSSTILVESFCINLSWDSERNGEYEKYNEHIYPLDTTLILRGLSKLDADNNLIYDGDEYTSDGTLTRRYNEFTVTENDIEEVLVDYENVTYFKILKPVDYKYYNLSNPFGVFFDRYGNVRTDYLGGSWYSNENVEIVFTGFNFTDLSLDFLMEQRLKMQK